MNNDRTVVLFTEHFPDIGGGQVSLLNRLKYLDRSQFKPIVVVPKETGTLHRELKKQDVETIEMRMNQGGIRSQNEKGILRSPHQLVKNTAVVGSATYNLIRTILSKNVDIIHTNSFKSSVLSVLPARITGVPLVYHAHSSRAYSEHGILDRYVCSNAALIIANSQFTAKTYYPWERKTSIVYNGFDLDQFKPLTDEMNEIRARYGVEQNQPLIGVVGRLTPRKRQIDLIRALPKILEKYPRTQTLLIGSSYEGLGKDYEEQLKTEIDKLGLNESVTITGYVEEIQQHISALDVLLLPSVREPFGRVIVESLLLETPVIGANDGGIPEIITDGRSGKLIPPKAPKAIADAVLTYLDDPDKAEQMAKVGRQTVRMQFEARNITEQIEQFYQGVTG